MRPVAVRPTRRFGAGAMAARLGALPHRAGPPVDVPALRDWIDGGDIWYLAERGGDLCGFQWIGARGNLSPDTCEIATFMAAGEEGIDASSVLFEATRKAARARSIRRLVARHARDNAGARAYCGSRGFEVARETDPDASYAVRLGINPMVMIYRV